MGRHYRTTEEEVVAVTVRIPKSIYEELSGYALRSDHSVNSFCRHAVDLGIVLYPLVPPWLIQCMVSENNAGKRLIILRGRLDTLEKTGYLKQFSDEHDKA